MNIFDLELDDPRVDGDVVVEAIIILRVANPEVKHVRSLYTHTHTLDSGQAIGALIEVTDKLRAESLREWRNDD